MPWVHGVGARAGDPLRARAGTCGGSARGPNSGSKVPRQGCRECVCGCARARGSWCWGRRVGSKLAACALLGVWRFATSALTSVRNHTDRIHSLRVRGGNETPNALGPTTDQQTRYQQARDSDRASERRVLLTFLTYSLTQTQYFTGGQVEHTVVTLPAQAFRARGVGRGGLGWGPMGRIVGQCYGAHAGSRMNRMRICERRATGNWTSGDGCESALAVFARTWHDRQSTRPCAP